MQELNFSAYFLCEKLGLENEALGVLFELSDPEVFVWKLAGCWFTKGFVLPGELEFPENEQIAARKLFLLWILQKRMAAVSPKAKLSV